MSLQIAGKLHEALALYRAILDAEPRHSAANHCLGMLTVQLRRPADALPFLHTAIETEPDNLNFWLGYLEALLLAGRFEDAGATLDLGRQHGLSGAAVEDFATRLRRQADATRGQGRSEAPGSPDRRSGTSLDHDAEGGTIRRRNGFGPQTHGRVSGPGARLEDTGGLVVC